ncbi:hypothetical protein C5Y96_14925 [Blastopirellula marina]|uniref:BURP domain-containing protein n=1 Tax=Blastopirellula marina TaxID=124 RepID=A0A2S8FF09_9BACT|nr:MULTISPECIES: hypothetical protein [Pirellulaceae]PQO30749.1 hypothetical protein C5Y96_14925 [Blastopirellula marina]RCS50886.1 hypothetical protein DTL36_14935 [Bremerella cremea]
MGVKSDGNSRVCGLLSVGSVAWFVAGGKLGFLVSLSGVVELAVSVTEGALSVARNPGEGVCANIGNSNNGKHATAFPESGNEFHRCLILPDGVAVVTYQIGIQTKP